MQRTPEKRPSAEEFFTWLRYLSINNVIYFVSNSGTEHIAIANQRISNLSQFQQFKLPVPQAIVWMNIVELSRPYII